MEEKQSPERTDADGKVVYRRVEPSDEREEGERVKPPLAGPQPTEHRLAPTLMPLLIGFAVLLVLIFFQGYLSKWKLDEVSTEVLIQEREHSLKSRLTLQLLVATTRLNNEARARGRAEGASTEDVRPRFDLPLRTARREVNDLLSRLERPPYAGLEQWRKLRQDIIEFVKATEDLETYNLQGFIKYRTVDDDIDALLKDLNREQDDILLRREELQNAAVRRINLLTICALVAGAIIAAATIREVQRRFRQMLRSVAEARREREFSTQILEGMVSAIAALDAHDRIRSANAAFLEIFPGATVGASIHEGIASPGALKMLEAATASRVRQSTYRGRWVCTTNTPECANRSFDIYSSPLEIDDGQGQIVTLVDVTEAAENEREVRRTEALAAVGQAAAQVAHEIKNPLGSIRLGVSMLRDATTDEDSLNTIDLVERGINHLNQLVVDVTEFSRQRSLERSEADLHSLIDDSLELVRDRLGEKRTPVEKHFSEEPLSGYWDADQLRQVLVNLLANAVDASPARAPVRISTERLTLERGSDGGSGNGSRMEAGKQQFARFSISDQGVGLDEETRQRIFEPFFTTKKRGTGLGLAIVKQIVEQHGGTIKVDSAPGKGTRFTIDLPLGTMV
jgi:signal transduction histidine kinase